MISYPLSIAQIGCILICSCSVFYSHPYCGAFELPLYPASYAFKERHLLHITPERAADDAGLDRDDACCVKEIQGIEIQGINMMYYLEGTLLPV